MKNVLDSSLRLTAMTIPHLHVLLVSVPPRSKFSLYFLLFHHCPPMLNSPTHTLPYGPACLPPPPPSHTHTHRPSEERPRHPSPVANDGLGLAPPVTVCDCNLRLTCWGYMASSGYLHNAQGEREREGERWRKPSENKRGGSESWVRTEEGAGVKNKGADRVGRDWQRCRCVGEMTLFESEGRRNSVCKYFKRGQNLMYWLLSWGLSPYVVLQLKCFENKRPC